MKVEQVYGIVNDVTGEILGKTDLVKEDLSNIVDVGAEIFGNTAVDNYVKTLVNRIGKVIFVSRAYSGKIPSVLMDSFEYGAVVEKISADMPDAQENKTWDLQDGQSYDQDVFYKPKVSAKFFNSRVTFEVPMSFTERQVKESFSSAAEVNSFITMLHNAVDRSMTVKIDGLIMRTINSMIAETIHADTSGLMAVNLLEAYNKEILERDTPGLTAAKALTTPEFIRFASMKMALYTDRLSRLSTLFNVGHKERFTSADMLHIVMLSDFKAAANAYLQSDTFHENYTALPDAETVPYWQGSGTKFEFDAISAINVNLASDKKVTVQQSGIIAVMFDREALGVSNLERRVTTNYNARAEFYNNYFKMECGAFNDLNENFVVFYVADPANGG